MSPQAVGVPNRVSSHELHGLAGPLEGEGSFPKGPRSAPRYPVVGCAAGAASLATGSSVKDVAEHFGTSVWCIDLRGCRTHEHMPRP